MNNLNNDALTIGITLESNGLNGVLVGKEGTVLANSTYFYPWSLEEPLAYASIINSLTARLPKHLLNQVVAISIGCTQLRSFRYEIKNQSIPISELLTYNLMYSELTDVINFLISQNSLASNLNESFELTSHFTKMRIEFSDKIQKIRRDTADFLTGWLLGDWRWGEESHNIRLGWNVKNQDWNSNTAAHCISSDLPEIISSGTVLGPINPKIASILGLPNGCLIIAGTTIDNAMAVAATPFQGEGVALLNDRLSLKYFTKTPIIGEGISNYRLGDSWLTGGSSNAGTSILKKFFTCKEVRILSRQINSNFASGIYLYPLLRQGEQFPVENPELQSLLEPRPISDALYLQALLEGLSQIECNGWIKLQTLNSPKIKKVISVGEGASNYQWRVIRQIMLKIKVENQVDLKPAKGLALIARASFYRALGTVK
uniref:Putative carbohydrate kinase, FGGY family protein n=1 Tax=Paulinella chromatophora TaxID=39717 RepID=B1X537_PAUCH|nr:Putative carbohydrate kinase, FGGY family protein [Paulinella chromatophora]ACB43056.1 Putative carbohydrate kinase, FGGY family protein [Paulinella chromatophora]